MGVWVVETQTCGPVKDRYCNRHGFVFLSIDFDDGGSKNEMER